MKPHHKFEHLAHQKSISQSGKTRSATSRRTQKSKSIAAAAKCDQEDEGDSRPLSLYFT